MVCGYSKNVIDFCSKNLKYFEFFGKLEGKTINSYKTQFTEDIYKNIKEEVKDACDLLIDTKSDQDYELFNNLNLPEKNSLLQSIETGNELLCLLKKKEFIYLIEDCNHRDFYKEMSSLLNQEIKTIDELQNIVETSIQNETLIYQKCLDEKNRVKELKKQNAKNKIGSFIKYLFIIIIGIYILYFIEIIITGIINSTK